MVPAPGCISYRMGITRSAFCVSGIHDLAQHALSNELLDAGHSLVPAFSVVGDFLPDPVVAFSPVY